MPKSREEARETRKKLIETAIKLFSKSGFTKTTLVQIGENAGYTRGAVYTHFKSKEEILIEIIKAHRTAEEDEIMNLLKVSKSNLDFLKNMALDHFDGLIKKEKKRSVQKIIVLDNISISLGQGEVDKFEKEDYIFIKGCFKDAIKSGEIRNGLSPSDLAVEYLSILGGFEYFYLKRTIEFECEKAVKSSIDRFLKSISR